MSSKNKSLSVFENAEIPSAKNMCFGIVVAEWNTSITEALYRGAYTSLLKHGALSKNIIKKQVPGSFELVLGGQLLANLKDIDAVICIGCIIQGETPHFDFICDAVANGIATLNINHNKPVIFGVLTTLNQQQAIDRSGGKHGNKGDEAAVTAIKMVDLQRSLKKKG